MSAGPEPCWVPAIALRAIHHEQILEHGGLQGIRSARALEAALARLRQRWDVEKRCTIPQLAAAYAGALLRAHPFADANKRSSFLVAVVFLGLNGFRFQASNEEVVLMIYRLAAGELPWADLQAWLKTNSTGPT